MVVNLLKKRLCNIEDVATVHVELCTNLWTGLFHCWNTFIASFVAGNEFPKDGPFPEGPPSSHSTTGHYPILEHQSVQHWSIMRQLAWHHCRQRVPDIQLVSNCKLPGSQTAGVCSDAVRCYITLGLRQGISAAVQGLKRLTGPGNSLQAHSRGGPICCWLLLTAAVWLIFAHRLD